MRPATSQESSLITSAYLDWMNEDHNSMESFDSTVLEDYGFAFNYHWNTGMSIEITDEQKFLVFLLTQPN